MTLNKDLYCYYYYYYYYYSVLLKYYRFQSFMIIASLPSHFQATSCLLYGNTARGAFVEFHNLHNVECIIES